MERHMQLSLERNRDVRIVRVGEPKLTYPVLSSFYLEVRQIVEEGWSKLVIDLEAVAYVDSASIGCLMEIHHLLRQRAGEVKLSGLHPRVETMLTLTGVHKVLDIHAGAAEAVAAFMRSASPGARVPGPAAGPAMGSAAAPS
jgi:anti-anti-sigma factor